MNTKYVLITGAGGEIGHGLIETLWENEKDIIRIVALDLNHISAGLQEKCHAFIQGDITNPEVVAQVQKYPLNSVFHLAALLSTSAEKMPETAHRVNVNGTMGLLEMSLEIGRREQHPVTFLFPSSIAAYGIPSLAQKDSAGAVNEDEWNTPETMYGINKLYCEHLGRYYTKFYKRLDPDANHGIVDFRALRFPGLISAFTVPSGGTSDYASEMIHFAARSEAYDCFVRESTRIPFMAMPDAIRAMLELASADRFRLSRHTYNISAFAPSAGEILAKVKTSFPEARISYNSHPQRQAIVDSWPADVDDAAARTDWGWKADYDFDRTFEEYLIPNIEKTYGKGPVIDQD